MKFTKMVKTALWSLLLVLFATSAAEAGLLTCTSASTTTGNVSCSAPNSLGGTNTITTTATSVKENSTVTVTTSPKTGYKLVALKLSYTYESFGKKFLRNDDLFDATVTNGVFTFKMPSIVSGTTAKLTATFSSPVNIQSYIYDDEKESGNLSSTTPLNSQCGTTTLSNASAYLYDNVYVNVTTKAGCQLDSVRAGYWTGTIGSMKYNQLSVNEATSGKYSFEMPNADVSVKTYFSHKNYTITKPSVTGGTYTVTTANGKTTAIAGEKVTVKPTAKQTDTEAYIVNTTDGVSYDVGDGVSHIIIGTNGEYSFYMPANNVTINVKFTRLKKVTIEHEGEGTAEIETTPTWTSPNGVNFYKGTPLFGAKAAQGYYIGYISVVSGNTTPVDMEYTDQTNVSMLNLTTRLNTSMFNGSVKVVFKKQDLAITNEIEDSHCQVEELRSTAQVGDDVSFKVSCDEGYGMDAVALYDATAKVPVKGGTNFNEETGYYHFTMPEIPVLIRGTAKYGITISDDNPDAETEFYGKKPADFDPDLKFVAGEMVTVNARSVSGEPVNVYYSYVDAVKGKQSVHLEMKTASWDVDPVNPWLEATFEMPAAPVVVRVVRNISHSIILSDEVENGISVYDASDPTKKMLTSAYQMERVNIEVLEFDEHPVDKVIASFTNSEGDLEKHKIAIERATCDGVPCQVGYFMMQNADVTITVVREKNRYSVSMESDEENSEFYIFEDEEDSDEEYREYAFVGEIVALQLSKVEGAKLVVSYDVYEGTEKKNTVTIDLSGKEYEAGFMFVDFVMPANNVVIHVTHVKEESGSGETGSGDEGGKTPAMSYKIAAAKVTNGKITVDGNMPAGETVTFKAVPNEGYVVDVITITKTGDSKTKVTSKAVSGKKDTYKFTMPEYDVTISVTFKAAEVEGEEDGDDEDSDDEKSEYAVASVSVPQFSVIASGRSLQISGVRAGSDIAVFSMQGKLIKKMRAQVSTIETVLPNAGSYMVKVGGAAKVVNVR